MPEYRVTYETTISVDVTIQAADDQAALTEEESQGIVEEYFQTLAMGVGAYRIVADASVDGMGPARVERVADGVTIYDEGHGG